MTKLALILHALLLGTSTGLPLNVPLNVNQANPAPVAVASNPSVVINAAAPPDASNPALGSVVNSNATVNNPSLGNANPIQSNSNGSAEIEPKLGSDSLYTANQSLLNSTGVASSNTSHLLVDTSLDRNSLNNVGVVASSLNDSSVAAGASRRSNDQSAGSAGVGSQSKSSVYADKVAANLLRSACAAIAQFN